MRFANVRSTIAFTVMIVLSAAGCGGEGITASSEPEDVGTLLVDKLVNEYVSKDLVWTKDGSEIVFLEDGVKAVNLSSKSVRTLDADKTTLSMTRATSGEWIYFVSVVPDAPSGSANLRISRVHPAGGTETVTFAAAGIGYRLAVSANERWVAIDGLLYDSETKASRKLPLGVPYGFSPDGSRLLYQLSSQSPAMVLVSTADGSTQDVHFDGFPSGIRWVGNSPQLLRIVNTSTQNTGETTRISEQDALTSLETELANITGKTALYTANWSDDGAVLGFWFEANFTRSELVVMQLRGARTVTARVDSDVGKPFFSPGGYLVAYPVFLSGYSRIYVKHT
jgi:hypothetical protein